MRTTICALAVTLSTAAVPHAAELSFEEASSRPLAFTFDHQSVAPPTTDPADDKLGHAVDVQGDYIAISAPGQTFVNDGLPGTVYIYRRGGGQWSLAQTLVPGDAADDFQWGTDVDFSEDGSILVIGSEDDNQPSLPYPVRSGAYVYRFDPLTCRYRFEQKLIPSTGSLQDSCGWYNAASKDWIAVACPNLDSDGAVVMFEYSESSARWVERQIIPSGGKNVAISGANLAVSDLNGAATVQMYRLGTDANSPWAAAGSALLGELVALSGDRLLVDKAPHPYVGDPDFYRRQSNGSWTASDFTHPMPPDAISWIYGFSENVLMLEEEDPGGAYKIRAYYNSGPEFSPVWNPTSEDAPVPVIDGFSFSSAADGNTMVAASNSGLDIYSASSGGTVPFVNGLLFSDAPGSAGADAAFAYQTALYGDDPMKPGTVNSLHHQFDTIYGQANRDNADAAEAQLRRFYPGATPSQKSDYEMLFLEIAYGRAAADLITSKEILRDLDRQRVGAPGGNPSSLFVNTEIGIVEDALEQSANGLNRYFALLEDGLGVPPIAGEAAGRSVFVKHVPGRTLEAGIAPHETILGGYRDLVLLYDLILHHARTASQLAYLYTTLIDPEDPAADDQVRALVGDTQRFVFEQRLLLDALFPQLTDPETYGLDILTAGIDAAIDELTAFEQNLDGTINLLGYEPDFLLLFSDDGDKSSFEAFADYLDPAMNSSSPLKRAIDTRLAAIDAIGTYGNNQGALEAEFMAIASVSTSALIPRLEAIVGVSPGEPGYDTPQDNVGSEIWQQINSMDIATQRIHRNSVEISNVTRRLHIEWARRAREAGINASLSRLIIDFGNQQASMTEEIGRIEAVQAASDSLTELFEIENILDAPFKLFAGVVNAGVQAGGEVGKGNLEASKERLAATQEAAVRDADDDILEANSRAFAKNILLELNTLVIDSQEATLLFRQEAGRLTSLVCEKEDLERRLAEVDESLARRYFADPVHRLRAIYETELANLRFREARQWLFFATRAAEYRWNLPFDKSGGYSSADLFKLRNAAELQSYFDDLNEWDVATSVGRSGDTNLDHHNDWFSLREDYFGYEQLDDVTGEVLLYDAVDPSGILVQGVDGITAFRWELQRLVEDCDDSAGEELCLRFDTLRRNGLSTGQTPADFTGNLFHPDAYLDRIEEFRIVIPGEHQNLATGGASQSSDDSLNTINAEISYYGSSIIRTEQRGTTADPDFRPDLIKDEFTSYPIRFYRSVGGPDTFQFEEGLIDKQAKALKIDRDRSLGDFAFDPDPDNRPATVPGPPAVRRFGERSVAATGWLLKLTPNNSTNPSDRLQVDKIDDILLHITHNSVAR